MTDILLITEQSIKNITNISDNMAGKLLLTAIRESQEINLREILGDALLDELKRQVDENDVRETYNQLILQCQYFLAYQSCANICMITSVKIDNAGLQRVSDEKMEPLPVSEVNQIHDYYQKRADFYCERLQHYLLQHKGDFPELNTRQCNTINANLYSSASCGIFLGGPRSKGTQRGYDDGLNANNSLTKEELNVEIVKNGVYDYKPKGYGFSSAHIEVKTPEIKNQEKNINITENGNSVIVPDPEYTGMGKISIEVDVHPSERLVRTYTENGVYPIAGEYNGGEISVETNPPARIDFSSIGYTESETDKVNDNIKNDIEYSKTLLENYSGGIIAGDKQLVYAPLLPTGNMTSFGSMFQSCGALVYVPLIDTSKGKTFTNMFANCESLTDIALIDTSKGTDFNGMFGYCYKLKTIPQIDTSSAIYLGEQDTTPSAWVNVGFLYGCESLETIPQIDTSNVKSFRGMFNGCHSLISVPSLDTSAGINFIQMFYGCYKLTEIPSLDTSKGEYFAYMFANDYILTTIPQLDLSNGTNFSYMFRGCSKLTDITFIGSINTEIGFDDCTKLSYESIKSILTACSKATNTNAKTVSFNRTIADQNQELTNLVSTCTEKGWQVTGLAIQ